jgi:hypothetical protein
MHRAEMACWDERDVIAPANDDAPTVCIATVKEAISSLRGQPGWWHVTAGEPTPELLEWARAEAFEDFGTVLAKEFGNVTVRLHKEEG